PGNRPAPRSTGFGTPLAGFGRPAGDYRHARGLDQPVRRDHGHAHGREVRPGARCPHAVGLQHPGRHHPARVRRRRVHPRRPGGRRGLDQGVLRPDHGLAAARPAHGPRPRCRRRRLHGRRRARRAAGEGREGAGERARARRAARRLDGGHPLGALPRSPRRLSDRARGCAQAQGDLLHPRGGLRRRRAQARSDRPDRAGTAGVRARAVAAELRPRALQGRLQHPGDPRPRCPRDRGGGGGRRRRAALRRRGHPHPARRTHVRAAARRGAAADLRDGAGHREGSRRGPAAQPREVRHGGV
ncbi:unnamed protein product, partial [Penicillium discolor]